MKKINLGELKVQSFVTSLEERSKKTIKGGDGETIEETFCDETEVPDPLCGGTGGTDDTYGANCHDETYHCTLIDDPNCGPGDDNTMPPVCH